MSRSMETFHAIRHTTCHMIHDKTSHKIYHQASFGALLSVDTIDLYNPGKTNFMRFNKGTPPSS